MLCPNCKCKDSKVIDSRAFEEGASIKRRRECLRCGSRFTTYERREEAPLMIAKSDGHEEPFERSKLLKSLITATIKRDIPLQVLEDLVDSVEADARYLCKGAVPSSTLGDQVLKRLRDVDQVAYVRFASVYRDFKSIEEFKDELARMELVEPENDDLE